MEELFWKELKKDVEKELIPSSVVLSNMRLIEEASKSSYAYSDPRFIPFYYHLSKYVQPVSMIELGARLGLFSGTFLKGCETVENLVLFQEETKDFYSPKLALKNVRKSYKKQLHFHYGKISDKDFSSHLKTDWDLAIINEELDYDTHLYYLEAVWENLNLDGYIVMDWLSRGALRQAFEDFCKRVNRQGCVFPTRYGTGMVRK